MFQTVSSLPSAPYLARETLDKSLFENNQTLTSRPAQKAAPEPSPQPATPSNDSQPATPSSEERGEDGTGHTLHYTLSVLCLVEALFHSCFYMVPIDQALCRNSDLEVVFVIFTWDQLLF